MYRRLVGSREQMAWQIGAEAERDAGSRQQVVLVAAAGDSGER